MSKQVKIPKTFWRGFHERERLKELLSRIGEKFIIFDTETTGLNENGDDRIIQLSALKCVVLPEDDFKVISEFNEYINPGRKLPAAVTAITGITDAMLKDVPTEDEMWPIIQAWFSGVRYVVCHNAQFDTMMLTELWNRHEFVLPTFTALDTLMMVSELHSRRETGSYKLGDLASFFGVDEGLTFHNSMDDVTATIRLLRVFIREYSEQETLPKRRLAVKACWSYDSGYTELIGGKHYPLRRLYVRLSDGSIIYLNQGYRPYEWTEKTPGTINRTDMYDVEGQVMRMLHCRNLEELSKVRTA